MINKGPSQSSETRERMRDGAGFVTIRHYFKPQEFQARCRLCAKLTLPPGASIGLHEHINEDELFIIQEGRGLVCDDGKDVPVEAGDAILTGKGAGHAISNTGTTDLVITAVIMQY